MRARILTALTVLVVLGWWVAVRPTALGGDTGYVLVSGQSMEPGLSTGDLVITRRQDTYRVGDVVAYRVPEGDVGAGELVIHRITGGTSRGWVLRGDNRDADDLWRPRDRDIVGRALTHAPGAGTVLATLRAPVPLALLAGLLTFWLLPPGPRPDRADRSSTPEPTPRPG